MTRYRIGEEVDGRLLVESDDGSYRAWHIATPTEATAIALALSKPGLIAELAAWRWSRETAGIVYQEQRIGTGRDDQAMLSGALQLAALDPDRCIDWKTADGWVRIDVPTLQAVGRAVGDHVQSCFSAESRVAARIDALTTLEDCTEFDLAAAWAAEGGP